MYNNTEIVAVPNEAWLFHLAVIFAKKTSLRKI